MHAAVCVAVHVALHVAVKIIDNNSSIIEHRILFIETHTVYTCIHAHTQSTVCCMGRTFLQALNDKFSGNMESVQLDTFPEEYFTCTSTCLACR